VYLLCLLLLLGPQRAAADPASHFGLNPRSMGMAGAFTAVAEDMSGLYYNPAGLVQLEGMTAGMGTLFGFPRLNEDGGRVLMPDETSFSLQVGVPLSGFLKDHLAFGVSLNMPWGKYLNGKLYEKTEPYFVMYDASIQILQVRVGGALRIPYKPLSFLSIGAALQVMGEVSGHVGFYAPLQKGGSVDPDSKLEAWAEMDVPTRFFFTVGAMAFLGDNWRVGVTYRSPQSLEVQIPIQLTVRMDSTLGLLVIPVEGLAKFTTKNWPQQVSVGASWRWKKLLLSLDLTWLDYSEYEIPYARVTLDIEKLKKDDRIQFVLPNPELLNPLKPQVEWRDMVVPRLGMEYQVTDWFIARAGYSFELSPLQGTELPIYDSDKHLFALSGRATFLRPWGLIPGRLNLDLSISNMWYVGRSILGSDTGGHIIGISFGVEVIFL